jgi:hypothetical protein
MTFNGSHGPEDPGIANPPGLDLIGYHSFSGGRITFFGSRISLTAQGKQEQITGGEEKRQMHFPRQVTKQASPPHKTPRPISNIGSVHNSFPEKFSFSAALMILSTLPFGFMCS